MLEKFAEFDVGFAVVLQVVENRGYGFEDFGLMLPGVGVFFMESIADFNMLLFFGELG